MKKENKTLKQSMVKSAKSIYNMLPIMFGVLLLISFVVVTIPKSAYSALFSKNILIDSVIGGVVGSISFGNPITSYIIGGELMNQGVSLVAVTAFIVAWVTVGAIQLPIEISIFGKRFAFARNILGFIFSIIVGLATVGVLWLI